MHHYCQGQGLAACLRLLSKDISVEFLDQHCAEPRREEILARIDAFDHVVAEPTIATELAETIGEDRLTPLPTLSFRGYHPDFFVLLDEGRPFPGPIGSSQSLLAYAAFSAGLAPGEAVSLFRGEVYEACGYHDQWEASREALLSSFGSRGFDLRRDFVGWSRRGPFMHSIIHPQVACLRDVARHLLERAGMRVLPSTFLPPDLLANGEVLPVYPEIAMRLGIAGDLLFKRGNDQRIFGLSRFVERSYAVFRRGAALKGHRAYAHSLERVRSAVEAFA